MPDPQSHSTAFAPGKIILSGEYAVLFGKRGIAIPSDLSIHVTFTPNRGKRKSSIAWHSSLLSPPPAAPPQRGSGEGRGVGARWQEYAQTIAERLQHHRGPGHFLIQNAIPLGKGMGSSTALIIGMCRAALGPDCAKIALMLENELSPGNSGIDFAVIWNGKPILFQQGTTPEVIEFDLTMLKGGELIDSGTPEQTTPELVAWMKDKYVAAHKKTRVGNPLPWVQAAIETIGTCTERILAGEPIRDVMRDHHRAQVTLGVVPKAVQTIIARIERGGGAAKVIGAGGRTGGGGMVLALPVR